MRKMSLRTALRLCSTRFSPREALNRSMAEPVVALVVAAGSGSRLGAGLPKALVELGGVSLVRRSVSAMIEGGAKKVVVTIPSGTEAEFAAALSGLPGVSCVVGGPQRQDSVRLGLKALARMCPASSVVLVHDAARPLVPPSVVRRVASAVLEGAVAVIPVVPVHDTIREVGETDSQVVDRDRLRAVQTPQGFRLGALLAAHEEAAAQGLAATDDAAVMEVLGNKVELVLGHHDALKITEPLDLALAQGVLSGRQMS